MSEELIMLDGFEGDKIWSKSIYRTWKTVTKCCKTGCFHLLNRCNVKNSELSGVDRCSNLIITIPRIGQYSS